MFNKFLCKLFGHKLVLIFLEHPSKIKYPKIKGPICKRCKKESTATFGEIKK